MNRKICKLAARITATLVIAATCLTVPMTTKAWDYSSPKYPFGKTNERVQSFEFANKVHEGWTMLDYANASSYWAVSEDEDAVTSDPATDYWNGNPVVYKYGEESRIYFADNRNMGIEANTGTHKYSYNMADGEEVPVWYWVAVGNPLAIHDDHTSDHDPYTYKSFLFRQLEDGKSPCGRVGNSTAWRPVCAICGETFGCLTYASANAVADMPSITIGKVWFLYSCRVCGNMEQGSPFSHTCVALSANRYHVMYNSGTNDPGAYGLAPQGTWYYNGADKYEGAAIESQTETIAECEFVRPGYVFLGWSTRKGGPVEFASGDDILLLQEVPSFDVANNDETITLYAVWGATASALVLDANKNNSFNGTAAYMGEDVTSVSHTYQIERPVGGDNLELDERNEFSRNTHFISVNNLQLPSGHSITLNAGEGTVQGQSSIVLEAQTYCTGISGSDSLIKNGSLSNAQYSGGHFVSALYTYGSGTDTDKIVFNYAEEPVVLPEAKKDGETFVGWYSDPNFSDGTYVGYKNDGYIPTENTVLYARYATMEVKITDVYYKENDPDKTYAHEYDNVARLESGFADNAEVSRNPASSDSAVQNETGAVNLAMSMLTPADFTSAYKAYYKKTGTDDWKHFDIVSGANGVSDDMYNKVFGTPGTDYTFKVASSGYYRLDAFGGEGQDYNSEYLGGKGGQTYGVYYLKEGDVLNIQVGGKGDTTTGGGKGTFNNVFNKPLNGGGYSKIVLNREGLPVTLMLASGGGSASINVNGYNAFAISNNSEAGLLTQTPSLLGNLGEYGLVGGGGGYVGGLSGKAIFHSHVSSCIHVHNSSCYVYHYHDDSCYEEHYSSVKCDDCGYWGGHYMWAHGCTNCGSTSMTPLKTLDCGKSEGFQGYGCGLSNAYVCGKDETYIEAAYPSYGGSSYVNRSLALTNTADGNIGSDAENNGDGKVVIKALAVGLKDGDANYAEIVGAGLPDTNAPAEKVQDVVVDNNHATGETVVSWDAPKSIGTSYDFKVELYKMENMEYDSDTEEISGFVLEQTSDVVSRTVESAIAGYYYILDNEETQDIASLLNSKGVNVMGAYKVCYTDSDGNVKYSYDNEAGEVVYLHGYTWADNHYEDDQIKYLQKTGAERYDFSFTNTAMQRYLHVAAVDVAGNVGPTEDVEVAVTALTRVTFHTNKLKYQLDPQNTVEYTSDIEDAIETVPATGMNKQNCYVKYDYAVDGSDKVGIGGFFDTEAGLSYGHDFPAVSAYGCTFLGWNEKPDGSGVWYAKDGTGDGSSADSAKTLVPANIFNDREAGHEITLYAIWTDDTSCGVLADDFSSYETISKTYAKTNWIAENGGLRKTETFVTTDNKAGVWSNQTTVHTYGQSKATGVWRMRQTCLSAVPVDGQIKAVAGLVYYPAGAVASVTYPYTLRAFADKPEIAMYSGTGSTIPDDLFGTKMQKLDVTYNLQGTFNVKGVAESRTSADMKDQATGDKLQGSGCVKESASTTIKVDRTIPSIYNYKIKQTTLGDFSIEDTDGNGIPDVEDAIQSGCMYTTFDVWVSDYNKPENGDFLFANDSSGIKGVYLYVFNAYDYSNYEIFQMPMKNTPIAYTKDGATDGTPVAAQYSIKVDFYAEFPNVNKLKFIIYAVDNAGNASKLNDKVYYNKNESGELEPGIPNTPEQKPDENNPAPDDSWIAGELSNFSVKAVAYNDEDELFNTNPETGEVFFQTGDIGHLEIWTIGYCEELKFGFGELGDESALDIKNGKLLEKYALDKKYQAGDVEEARVIPFTTGEQIFVNTFCVVDEVTGQMVAAQYGGTRNVNFGGTLQTESELVTAMNTKDGVPYAQHYTADIDNQEWWDEGVSIRIPSSHVLEKTGEVDKYGTPIYKNEKHSFAVVARKGESETDSMNSFILWDMASNDVHYRVIHEN